jgi:hypothetical protein
LIDTIDEVWRSRSKKEYCGSFRIASMCSKSESSNVWVLAALKIQHGTQPW